jgi:hypothetical protein
MSSLKLVLADTTAARNRRGLPSARAERQRRPHRAKPDRVPTAARASIKFVRMAVPTRKASGKTTVVSKKTKTTSSSSRPRHHASSTGAFESRNPSWREC